MDSHLISRLWWIMDCCSTVTIWTRAYTVIVSTISKEVVITSLSTASRQTGQMRLHERYSDTESVYWSLTRFCLDDISEEIGRHLYEKYFTRRALLSAAEHINDNGTVMETSSGLFSLVYCSHLKSCGRAFFLLFLNHCWYICRQREVLLDVESQEIVLEFLSTQSPLMGQATKSQPKQMDWKTWSFPTIPTS